MNFDDRLRSLDEDLSPDEARKGAELEALAIRHLERQEAENPHFRGEVTMRLSRSAMDCIKALLPSIQLTCLPDLVFVDAEELLHDWALRHGYVKKEGE